MHFGAVEYQCPVITSVAKRIMSILIWSSKMAQSSARGFLGVNISAMKEFVHCLPKVQVLLP